MKKYWKKFVGMDRKEQMITVFAIVVIVGIIVELIR